MVPVDVAWSRPSKLGEGPIWFNEHLYWVDITGQALLRYEPATGGQREYALPEQVGTVVPRASGGMVLGLESGLAFFDEDTETLKRLPAPTLAEMHGRFNDGKCDPRGRFFVGTMNGDGEASLFRVDADLSVRVVLSGLFTSNGLCWNETEGRMYYIDSRTGGIDVLDYEPDSGAISDRRPLYKAAEGQGRPDGMTIDTEGRLWAAHYDGAGVHCVDPDSGRSLEKIEVPARFTTACWFGGGALSQLYITTGIQRSAPEDLARYPESGSLFVATPGARGLPTVPFAG